MNDQKNFKDEVCDLCASRGIKCNCKKFNKKYVDNSENVSLKSSGVKYVRIHSIRKTVREKCISVKLDTYYPMMPR